MSNQFGGVGIKDGAKVAKSPDVILAGLAYQIKSNQIGLLYSNEQIKLIKLNTQYHNSIMCLHIPFCRTHHRLLTFEPQAVRIWNDLPAEIKQLPLNKFKKVLKNRIFDFHGNN